MSSANMHLRPAPTGPRYSDLVRRIATEGARAWDIHERALVMRETRPDLIILSIGDHDFATPAPIVDAAVESLERGRHHYVGAAGEAHLRQAIAGRHSASTGQAVGPENVVVLPGAQCGLFAAALCLLGPGDEVIVPEPMYATYESTLRAGGAEVVAVALRPEAGFQLDPADVADAVSARTRAVLFNSPHNPTGAVASAATVEGLAEICMDHGLWLISDEVYASLTYGAPHISPCSIAGMGERTVTVSSLAKSHAMTGWRVGWAVAPAALAAHMETLAGCMLFGSPPFIQDAAAFALERGNGEVAAIRETYLRRLDAVCARLEGMEKIAFHRPQGGMFLMPDIRATGLSAYDFALGLLEHEGVSVTPGDGFGPSGAGHVRLSLSADEAHLAEACNRLERYLSRL